MKVWSIFYGNLSISQGPTTHFSELALGLQNNGVEVVGYAPAVGRYHGPHKEKLKIKYTLTLNLPMIRVVLYDFFLMIRLLFTPKKPDIIYVRAAYFTLFAPLIAKLFRKKLVLEINGYVVEDIKSKGWVGFKAPLGWLSIWCEKTLHNLADASIIVTETIYNEIHKNFKVPKEKLFHLKNGVNTNHFQAFDKNKSRQLCGLDLNKKYIGYVGCFTDWDGIEYIVRALPAIKKRIPAAQVLLIGDGNHRSDVEKEVAALGLTQDVIFTGYVEYRILPQYLNSLDVAVAPYGGSAADNQRNQKGISSLKCLEYLSMSLPVVTSNVPGNEFIDGLAGYIVPQGDVQALSNKVIMLLNDTEFAVRFSRAGREYVIKNASWQSVADKTLKIFEGVLNK